MISGQEPNSLVIGMGEVGRAVYEVTGSGLSFSLDDPNKENAWQGELDVMHICFPYSETFVEDVQRYIKNFEPLHIIVWATVPIGTCRKIDERVVHTPVEGVHPNLSTSIRSACRFIGYNIGEEGRWAQRYLWLRVAETEILSRTETTELLKLRSTAKYGINLVWAQYDAELCKQFGVPYDSVMTYDSEYNKLFAMMGDNEKIRSARYVLFEPDGRIGGHCVVPNARLLNEQFPSDLLDKIIAMGEGDA